LRTRCSQLESTNADLSRQNKKLNSKNHFLAEVNEAFATENDELRDSVERYSRYRLPKSLRQQEPDDNRPSKRPKTTKSKGKKPVRVTDDELEYDSNSEEHEPEIDKLNVKGARVCLNLHFFF
jgi:hypothetical protein